MSNLDCCGPFDNYIDYNKLQMDQLYDKLLKGFNMESFTGTLSFLPLFRKKAPVEINKMRYSHVFFKMYRTDWRHTRNNLYMAAVKVPDRPKPLFLYKDDLNHRRVLDLTNDDEGSNSIAYAVDKIHPCEYCIVVASRYAYIRLLLLLYNEDYSMIEYDRIRVLYWSSGRFVTSKESPFWNLVRKDKRVALFFDTFSVPIERPSNIEIQGHNSSTIDVIKSADELYEALKTIQ